MLEPYIKAFRYAFVGIASFISTERNAKIHLMAAIAACLLGVYVGLEAAEWLWVAAAIFLVLVTEMINSAIEKICDRITTQKDPAIKVIKDVAAGAVLLTSIFALLVGAILIAPKLF